MKRVFMKMRAEGRAILARKYTAYGVLFILAGLGAGSCTRHAEVDPGKVRSRIQHYLRESLERGGGRMALSHLTSYRAEGVITLVPERRVLRMVRMVDAAGRMRIELRDTDHGEVRIVSETGAWAGPNDRSLVFSEPTLLDALALAAVRRDFPLRFADHGDSLGLERPDKKKRPVLRAYTRNNLWVDHHLDKKSRLAAISVRAVEEPDLVYRVELSAYRKLRGAQFPFRETIYRNDERVADVRFRDVEIRPELPVSLFVPRVTGESAPDSTVISPAQ